MEALYELDDLIDGRFKVIGFCSDTGGMGRVLNVTDTNGEIPGVLALKYCKEKGEEYTKRFRREVRLLESFKGNSKVVEIFYSNVDHSPPYFVMKLYPEGDLTNLYNENLKTDFSEQERIFNLMIDCISELHIKDVFHRDIKPQNFLIEDGSFVVSDFGLGMESGASTRFTSSSMFWGTQGYLPPEFQKGGFKYADETSDIFMLGKSFYVLLVNSDPTYLMNSGLNPLLFRVIERACDLDKTKRYSTLSELRQSLKIAFDVILKRGGYVGEVNQLIDAINNKLESQGRYESDEVIKFIDRLQLVSTEDQIKFCLELRKPIFSIITQENIIPHIGAFLDIYENMVHSEQYGWAFSEEIADNMQLIFNKIDVPIENRVKALEIAISSAYLMNRFAAMHTCASMIMSINDEYLGAYVANVIQDNRYPFITDIEPSQCKSENVRSVLRALENT